MFKCDGLKINRIGQSATKLRIGESPTTIQTGSRVKLPEAGGILTYIYEKDYDIVYACMKIQEKQLIMKNLWYNSIIRFIKNMNETGSSYLSKLLSQFR